MAKALTGRLQILSITCDNTSSNDTMIIKLVKILNIFPGPANRTRCFTHILNLIARSIIWQFDLPKAQADKALDAEISELAADLDPDNYRGDMDGDNKIEDDKTDGWVDERTEMLKAERDALDMSVWPMRLVLVKVSVGNLAGPASLHHIE